VRVRFAPAPSGSLHVGNARTALFNWLFARHHGGVFILRIEDTDRTRVSEEYIDRVMEVLRWLGLDWDEGTDVGGPFAPYTQSARRGLYLEAWARLVAEGFVYPCSCSRRDVARAAEAPHEGGNVGSESRQHPHDDEPVYPGTCRPRAGEAVAAVTEPAGVNWRFRVPDGEEVGFEDLKQGRQTFVAGRDFGDFAVWRRDDVPAYQLAVVVDDALMRITEVVRGADLLKSTARQLLLQRALGYETPAYFHCDLVTDERGERLAKRYESLSIRALRAAGLTPEQVRERFR
jgi:glutamyl-tRNA synthetase